MIGKRVKQVRESLGVKQNWLANKVGMSATWLHDIESGRLRLSAEMAKKIADALEVDVAIFFTPNVLETRTNDEQAATSA